MRVVSIATAKRQASAATQITHRPALSKDSPQIKSYRRLLRVHIRALEQRALAGGKNDPDRMEAVRGLSALVLAMYVAEHDLRSQIQVAVASTAVA
jgi:hypothetical protein